VSIASPEDGATVESPFTVRMKAADRGCDLRIQIRNRLRELPYVRLCPEGMRLRY
jgi:hypothetical protein